MEIRYLPQSADIKDGDHIVTSGVDGVYPAGIPVARVTRVERNQGATFARIAPPLAGVQQTRYMLVLGDKQAPAASAGTGPIVKRAGAARSRRRRVSPDVVRAPQGTAQTGEAPLHPVFLRLRHSDRTDPAAARQHALAPDFIGMLILYWVINQPRRVNIGTAFLLGLVADISTAGLFGQHALTYSITAYLALARQRQVVFNLGQQTLVVLGLLLTNQIIMVVVRMLTGSAFVGWAYFLPP